MRDFSWKYFALTGDVESFMLYREVDQYGETEDSAAPHGQVDEVVSLDVPE